MLRIMLPVTVAASRPIRDVLSVGVSYEVVVVIDVDIVVAAPPAVVAPSATPSRSHCDADAKRNRHPRGVITGGRISNRRIRISWCAVHHGRVITGNINNFRTGLLDHDDLLAFDQLGFHFLLLT